MKDSSKLQPFRNIALTFSGGGYRAATFSLGILSYLNHLKINDTPLLQNVKGLSTVSGGTITGVCYAISQAKNIAFEDFYHQLYTTLDKDELLSRALGNLSNDQLWQQNHKKRTLINSFALAYQELFTHDTFKNIKSNHSHLQDVCFNATDFSYGLAFRFQTSGSFGNYRVTNSNLNKLAPDMKLADFIAASSCFPLGFEPIIMPDDFVENHKDSVYIAVKNQEIFKKGLGLMDGGIVDNQGIGSIMKADNRRDKDDKFDLIMVCDVGSYIMEPWEPSEIDLSSLKGSKSIKQVFKLLESKIKNTWWLFIPLLASPILFYLATINSPGTTLYVSGGATTILAILGISIKLGLRWAKHKVLKLWGWLMKLIPDFISDKLFNFEGLKLRIVKRMIEERVSSGIKMINEIFLKQIRRLNYQLFYTDESLKHRRVTTLIYELTQKQYVQNDSDEKDPEDKTDKIPAPNDGIYAAAKIATEMGTTLWFTKEDKEVERLKNLVSCGQFTACYNLLKYFIALENSEEIDTQNMQEIKDGLLNDWEKFRENPYWLFETLEVSNG